MAKKTRKIKKEKKHLTITGRIFALFIFSFLAFIFSSIIVKSYNVSLHCELLKMKDEIVEKQANISTLQQELIVMKDQDYVLSILKDEGLKYNESAVYVVEQ